MPSGVDVDLTDEPQAGERLLWSGGPCQRSHWLNSELWIGRLFSLGWLGLLFVMTAHQPNEYERPMIERLAPLMLGVAASTVPIGVLRLLDLLGVSLTFKQWPRLGRCLLLLWLTTPILAAIALTVVWANRQEPSESEPIYLMIMALAGGVMLSGLFFGPWAEGVTCYALTDRRVIVFKFGPFGVVADSLPLAAMLEIPALTERDERGSITFWTRTSGDAQDILEFVDIHDAPRVHGLIEAARVSARNADRWRPT